MKSGGERMRNGAGMKENVGRISPLSSLATVVL